MFKVKVKFIHLCLLSVVFLICVGFLYKDIFRLKKDLSLYQKTLENVFLRVNNVEKFNALGSVSNTSKNVVQANPSKELRREINENVEDDSESSLKANEYEQLLRHMSTIMEENGSESDEYEDEEDENEYEEDQEEGLEEKEELEEDEYDEEDNDEETDEEFKGDEQLDNNKLEEVIEETVEETVVEPVLVNKDLKTIISEKKNIDIDDDIKINVKPNSDNLNSKTVAELKDILKNKKLSVKGNKNELISRILK